MLSLVILISFLSLLISLSLTLISSLTPPSQLQQQLLFLFHSISLPLFLSLHFFFSLSLCSSSRIEPGYWWIWIYSPHFSLLRYCIEMCVFLSYGSLSLQSRIADLRRFTFLSLPPSLFFLSLSLSLFSPFSLSLPIFLSPGEKLKRGRKRRKYADHQP